MPDLNFMGVKRKDMLTISKALIDDVSSIAGTQRSSIVLNVNEADVVFDGEFVAPSPSVNVYWFDRPQQVQDACAKAITKHITGIGYPDILVMFHTIYPNKMYSKGEHR